MQKRRESEWSRSSLLNGIGDGAADLCPRPFLLIPSLCSMDASVSLDTPHRQRTTLKKPEEALEASGLHRPEPFNTSATSNRVVLLRHDV
jgi:hypothetical protein